jgi:hypothetical protein
MVNCSQFSLILTFILVIQLAAAAQNPPAAAPRDPVLVTISEKTTRITAPLKPSDYPDFLEAANIAAKGKITPETNGAVLLVRAVGPRDNSLEELSAEFYKRLGGSTPGEQQAELYKRLGIEPLPENQQRHVFYDDFVKALQEGELPKPNAKEKAIDDDYQRNEDIRSRVMDDFEHCSVYPWSTKDYPLVARWLQEQEKSFAQLDRLREYPDAYLPLLVGPIDHSLRISETPIRRICEELVFDLNIRAFNAVDRGNFDESLDDLGRISILSQYLLKSPDQISLIIALSIRENTRPLVNQLSLNSSLTPLQLTRLKSLLQKYNPPIDTLLIKMADQGERLLKLESACRFAEFGAEGTEKMPLSLHARKELDYDYILNFYNTFYDRFVEALRMTDPKKRSAALADLNGEISKIYKLSESKPRSAMLNLNQTGKSVLVAEKMLGELAQTIFLANSIEQKEKPRQDLWNLSIALAEYRRKEGHFPKQLEPLVPGYISAIPTDRYTGELMKYQSDGKGVLVYSLGLLGEDHQGYEGEDSDKFMCHNIAIYTNDRRPKPPKPKTIPDFFD